MPTLTKRAIEKEALPAPGERKFLRDTEVKGFGCRITQTARSFYVEHRIKGQPLSIRITIGAFPAWTVEDARQRAREMIVDMDKGIDPREARRNNEPLTLSVIYAAYKESRKLKPSTERSYDRLMRLYIADWHKKRIDQISETMVAKRHIDLGNECGEQISNLVLSVLKTIINFAQAKYGEDVIPKNPVMILDRLKQWYPKRRRSRVVKKHDLPKWFEAIEDLRADGHHLSADYLVFVLLTGTRKMEAASLTWEGVDFEGRSLTFYDTKNGSDRTIPITRYLNEILERRKEQAAGSLYVFPSSQSKSGHIVDMNRTRDRVRDSAAQFSMHDLRRTYATVLESLDVSQYALKALLGHSLKGDVTGGHYVVIDIDRLREPAQRLEDTILRLAGVVEGNVVRFPKQA